MVRFLVSAPLALLLALLLFYGLAVITSMGERKDMVVDPSPVLDFLMVRQESELRVRERKPPEPLEVLPEPPDIPRLEPVPANIDPSTPTIEVPNISMELDMNLSPALHNLRAPPRVSVDTNPVVLTRIPPRYPQRALRRRQEGKVLVEFIITEQGTVKEGSMVVLQSTPPGVFDEAVMRAVERWRFEKRLVNGLAVPFKARQELEFKLN
jgi:protein TonB